MQFLRCRQLDPDPKLCYFGSATLISMYYCGGGRMTPSGIFAGWQENVANCPILYCSNLRRLEGEWRPFRGPIILDPPQIKGDPEDTEKYILNSIEK